ncbi:hypothetical protein [Caenispirillum bisanense]|uniref:Uncharacterized protein n=1 Tax=Caenispirillum bisanense TaxID=414052 RepID=A0A286GQ75_9PROT|nr:hypothetical protein [Caenispirillum bisanense]SOD97239.1 hypothetical protein SAMN05421508_106347 [Caenispirillum bisanense]
MTDINETIKQRLARDPAFRDAMAREGIVDWDRDVEVDVAAEILGLTHELVAQHVPVENGLSKLRHVIAVREELTGE